MFLFYSIFRRKSNAFSADFISDCSCSADYTADSGYSVGSDYFDCSGALLLGGLSLAVMSKGSLVVVSEGHSLVVVSEGCL